MYLCRFYPGYCLSFKDVPCESAQAAQTMKDWFNSTGVAAEVVLVTKTEKVIE